MPFPLIPVVIAVSALLATGAVVHACDQENKREEEQKRARNRISKLKNRISELEQEHDRLLPELGKKNHQVCDLADEIRKLRAKLEGARRSAA